MADELWARQLESSERRFKERLVSIIDLECELRELLASSDCPIDAIRVQIERPPPFTLIEVAISARDAHSYFDERALDAFGATLRLTLWRKEGSPTIPPDLPALLSKLFDSFWKPELRGSTSTMIERQNADRHGLVDASLQHLVERHGSVAIFYCDLDNFKAANDDLGHQEGDRIIREYSAVLDSIARPEAIAFHRSGDEFAVFLGTRSATTALQLADRFMRALKAHDFHSGDHTIGSKIGIMFASDGGEPTLYNNIEHDAEAATVNEREEKQRGRARLRVTRATSIKCITDAHARSLAISLTKARLSSAEPFDSPWLNLISQAAHAAATNGLEAAVQHSVDTIVAWIAPDIDHLVLTSAEVGRTSIMGYPPIFSFVDVAIASAHGVLRSRLDSEPLADTEVNFSPDGETGRLLIGDIDVYRWGAQRQEASETIPLGGCFRRTPDRPPDDTFTRCILIKIGHSGVGIPLDLFTDVITIDDRPTIGGGLPDFWEAAIARLIWRISSDSDQSDVLVFGNTANAAQTVARLNAISSWPSDTAQLSYKTGMTPQQITATAERLKDHVHLFASTQGLLPVLAASFMPAHTFMRGSPADAPGRQVILRRELRSDDFQLIREDGCRTDTIAQAYAVVLEIARRIDPDDAIVDQAGQPLRELVDFKVSLLRPTIDTIPRFYESDGKSLQEYFEATFVHPDGKFREPLERDGQLDAVITHLANVLTGEYPFNTRRAVLVVPHVPVKGEDISPLGLISVRIIPRFTGKRIVLSFSYTWRTVEALVGFPYSAYGSVRFSQHLCGLLAARISQPGGLTLDVGEVNYIAHSLHFFLDTFNQSIARRIIDEVSE